MFQLSKSSTYSGNLALEVLIKAQMKQVQVIWVQVIRRDLYSNKKDIRELLSSHSDCRIAILQEKQRSALFVTVDLLHQNTLNNLNSDNWCKNANSVCCFGLFKLKIITSCKTRRKVFQAKRNKHQLLVERQLREWPWRTVKDTVFKATVASPTILRSNLERDFFITWKIL